MMPTKHTLLSSHSDKSGVNRPVFLKNSSRSFPTLIIVSSDSIIPLAENRFFGQRASNGIPICSNTESHTMIVSLLLTGLYVIGLVDGDDSSSSAGDDTTITSMTTAKPTYTVLAPTDSPTLDLFGSVTFIWSAEGYNVGGYFCQPVSTRSYMESYTSWMSSEAGKFTSQSHGKPFDR
jgi:hypothetical protein